MKLNLNCEIIVGRGKGELRRSGRGRTQPEEGGHGQRAKETQRLRLVFMSTYFYTKVWED